VSQRAREECPCCRAVTAFGDQAVDDLAVLVDRAVEIGPAAGDLDVGLVDEPPVTRGVTSWPGGVDELGSEGLHPADDRDVVDLDAALSEQLLNVAVRQPVTQIPAHSDRDHLAREPVPGRSERARPRANHTISLSQPATIDQRNRAIETDGRGQSSATAGWAM
jgi:hypothetical protein